MKLHWKIIISVIGILFIISLIILGIRISNGIQSVMDPVKREETARSIISYNLPEQYHLVFAADLFLVKVSSFQKLNTEQQIMLVQLGEKDKISDEEFRSIFWYLNPSKEDIRFKRIEQYLFEIKNLEDFIVKDKGILITDKGVEMPYIICSFVVEGENREGLWGVINFKKSKRTIFIMDMAEEGKYNFVITEDFIKNIGPPAN